MVEGNGIHPSEESGGLICGMKVFVITSEWPNEKHPNSGIFVKSETLQLQKNCGVEFKIFYVSVNKWIRQPWRYFRQARKEIDSFQPDLIHIHWAMNSWFARGVQAPKVITFRGFDYLNLKTKFEIKRRFLGLFSRSAWNEKNHLIFVKDYPKRNEFPGFSTVIPSGLNEDILREVYRMDQSILREKYGIPNDRILLTYIGPGKNASKLRVINKNKEWFLNFWNELDRRYPQTYFLLWLEDRSQKEVLENLHASDFFFLTSSDEGSPNIIKEALVLGTYFFSTDCGDVSTHLQNYPQAGELIDLDVEKTIHQLRAHRPQKMKLNEEFLNFYGSKNQSNRVFNVYKLALANSTQQPL